MAAVICGAACWRRRAKRAEPDCCRRLAVGGVMMPLCRQMLAATVDELKGGEPCPGSSCCLRSCQRSGATPGLVSVCRWFRASGSRPTTLMITPAINGVSPIQRSCIANPRFSAGLTSARIPRNPRTAKPRSGRETKIASTPKASTRIPRIRMATPPAGLLGRWGEVPGCCIGASCLARPYCSITNHLRAVPHRSLGRPQEINDFQLRTIWSSDSLWCLAFRVAPHRNRICRGPTWITDTGQRHFDKTP